MRRFRRAFVHVLLVSVIILPVCLVSCSSSGSTIIPETTKVLDEATLNCLSGASVNSSTLSFGNVTEQLSSLSVGDVIVCGVSNVTPYGLLRKVTDIITDDGQMTVETVNATLEDAIQDCTIDTTWHLESDGGFVPIEVQGTAAENALSTELGNALAASTLASDEGFYLHLDDVALFDGIWADVWVFGNLDFNIGWTIRGSRLTEAHSQATISLTSEVELSCEIVAPVIHAKIELYRQYLSPFTVMVGPFPVVILPILSLNVGLDGEVSAGITVGVTGTATLTAGLQYSDGDWSPITNFSTSHEWREPNLTAGCEVKAYAGPRLSFLLYGMAGPHAEVRGYLELNADTFKTPCWELYGGLEVDVGFRVEAMGHKVADYEKSLAIWYRQLLASGMCGIFFPDPNLEAAIREAIGKPEGPIYLSDLEGLTYFDADDRNIADLTGLEYCTDLIELRLRYNQISDISPLANLTNLTALWLGSEWLGMQQISDLSPLANLTGLLVLDLDGNQISDISPLANLTNLTTLYLSGNQISDISPLANLTGLTDLGLQSVGISDLSPLANLTNLTYLWLDGNGIISDISPLANLTNLIRLSLWWNQISDISPLANLTNLRHLWLEYNQISNICPLVGNPGLGAGDRVCIWSNPLSSYSIDICIPQLEVRGVEVWYE